MAAAAGARPAAVFAPGPPRPRTARAVLKVAAAVMRGHVENARPGPARPRPAALWAVMFPSAEEAAAPRPSTVRSSTGPSRLGFDRIQVRGASAWRFGPRPGATSASDSDSDPVAWPDGENPDLVGPAADSESHHPGLTWAVRGRGNVPPGLPRRRLRHASLT